MLPSHLCGCRPQPFRNRQASAVRTPPTLEASVNPLHANRNLRQCLRAHRRSSVPCRDYNRRYQLRPRSFMQVYRKLTLHPKTHGRLVRLGKEAERDGAYRVAKRLQAVVLNSEGRTSSELAGILKAPRSKVSEWLSLYQKHGVDGLLEGYRSGRPSSLTAEQRAQLGDILESGPVAYGLDTGIWTSPMLAWVIEEEFGITYHPGHVRKLLHQMGFSVQRPRRVLARADAAAQDRWHRRTYPNLKKKPEPKAGR